MLSIIINHYKSPEVLKLCLNYAIKNAPQESEFIVTDSETTDKSETMMRHDFPDVKFIPEPKNIGFAKSVNRGIKASSGEFILIINADVIISNSSAVPTMIEYMKKNPDVGMLGPRLLNINGEHQDSCFRFYSPKTIFARRTPFGKTRWGKKELDRFLMRDSAINAPIPTDWLMGSAMLVSKSALKNVGLISEDYFMYMEDVDWARNFWRKNYKVVYFPNVFLYHYHFQSSRKRGAILDILTNKYARIHLVSAIKYFRKFGIKTPKYGV
ncbi:MAG: hypothetical protein A3B96_04375 [Candidatus Spechtbacteria bacterium RIFCSPHIGHO2_02_FULL_43_15b]|uniref:Glycosyltransferase 2-like domain-containing protein n=1 Tax=Candidatus Spechtbacteria bacterium RIFCSPHIGHO2_01_FULL_43_30 TaxID=1802158 RepID=A0A1G2H7W6_9BACT|nr:MAG: hypothetical protein A2827_01935 [Candidatus Spechtbacteria bacterium RIFCSPHIGHO2_01_FULL_43_30]OGZ58571.1 MAG: hypothetical protein A3B96_04375 [Candidatus Spechtbacteria bacterium RIFCSPHIGHO2_02_FULL_43_15b]